MKLLFLNTFLLYFSSLLAQSDAGTFSLGMRSTISVFDHDKNTKIGYGTGGQFRIQILDRLNTEWYLDYLQQDLSDVALRKDVHIGWSLMFYPWLLKDKEKLQYFKPYIVAGHCFDWSILSIKDYRKIEGKKFSSALQGGIGAQVNITKNLDFTTVVQYMIHLGKDLQLNYNEETHLHGIENHKHTAASGHLLITMSINYKIARLWKTKK